LDSRIENSIKKRTENTKHKMFLGLSAGYDSGAITCELNKQSKKYAAYTVIGGENPKDNRCQTQGSQRW